MNNDVQFQGGGSKNDPKNRIIEGKNRIKGGGKVKKDPKNWTSFMHDPLAGYIPTRTQKLTKPSGSEN